MLTSRHGLTEIMDQIAKDYVFNYRQMQADIDEQALGDRSSCPESLVLLLAQAKADALKARIPESSGVLITCDQVVVCNGRILEKPADPDEVRSPQGVGPLKILILHRE